MAMKKTSFFHRLSTLSVCVIALSIFCNLPLAAQQGEKQAQSFARQQRVTIRVAITHVHARGFDI